MDKILDLYSDYLLCSTGQTSATGLSAMSEGAVSHDRITRFLSGQDFNSKKLWLDKPLIRQYESAEACLVFDDIIKNQTWMKIGRYVCIGITAEAVM